eukprot:831061-Prorocentrum_minimum.AAC.1
MFLMHEPITEGGRERNPCGAPPAGHSRRAPSRSPRRRRRPSQPAGRPEWPKVCSEWHGGRRTRRARASAPPAPCPAPPGAVGSSPPPDGCDPPRPPAAPVAPPRPRPADWPPWPPARAIGRGRPLPPAWRTPPPPPLGSARAGASRAQAWLPRALRLRCGTWPSARLSAFGLRPVQRAPPPPPPPRAAPPQSPL